MIEKINLADNEVYGTRPFGALAAAGFTSTYRAARRAVKYESTDPVTAAELYRHVIEGVIEDAYAVIGARTDGHLASDIHGLVGHLDEEILPAKVVGEMRLIKTLASHDYIHFERSSRHDPYFLREPEKDCRRLRMATEVVTGWLISFKDKYPEWKKEQLQVIEEETAPKEDEKLGWWIGGATALIGVILFFTNITGTEE